MRRAICIAVLAVLFVSSSAWAVNAKIKEAMAEKEAYFKDPKSDVLFVITAVDTIRGAEAFEHDIDIVLTMTDGRGTDTFKARTPCVMRFPMSEAMEVAVQEYRKTSGMEKEKFLMGCDLGAPTITIMAQSDASFAGLCGRVYYAGKEVSHDKSAIAYGAVNLNFTLPIRQYLEAQK